MHMAEDTRVFTDATHSSIRGCKNSIARLAIESRAAWALENEEETKPAERSIYKRRYRWNERNLMQESSDNTQSVHYRYGQDGQRALKSSNQSETLYFNTMWSWLHNSSAYNTDRESKHIYLGTERLVTRMNGAGTQGNAYTAQVSTYYYHSDHLGSAQLITDNEGREYERIEYTPYGEYWVEKRAPENRTLPFKFTGKERDEETGLYYYGARYMDPRTSRWLSTDPALTDYIPMAPVDDNARKHNQNLPGMGGIYNSINMHLYHYAGNNPVKYTDPDGKKLTLSVDKSTQTMNIKLDVKAGDYRFLADFKVNVTTHVVANSDSTQSNKKANVNLNPQKRNDNGSAWTQFPNGEWNITGAKDGPNQNIDGTVDSQLTTNAYQILPIRNDDGSIKTDKNGNMTVNDTGYNIHFTENSNTAGCIGVKDKLAMKFIMFLYRFNEKHDPNTSKIKVTGSEE